MAEEINGKIPEIGMTPGLRRAGRLQVEARVLERTRAQAKPVWPSFRFPWDSVPHPNPASEVEAVRRRGEK